MSDCVCVIEFCIQQTGTVEGGEGGREGGRGGREGERETDLVYGSLDVSLRVLLLVLEAVAATTFGLEVFGLGVVTVRFFFS